MIAILQKAYETLNKELFDGRLRSIHLVPNLTLKTAVLAFFPSDAIHIGAKIAEVTPTQVLDQLVHSMVHVFNFSRGIEDFATLNKYHRADFCHEALRVGLVVSYHTVRGWSNTTSDMQFFRDGEKVRYPEQQTNDLLRRIYRKIQLCAVEFSDFQGAVEKDLAKRPRKDCTFRYVCKCRPPMIVRSGRRPGGPRPFHATCCYCGANFVLG
jgi:hypothetical protein